MIGQNEQLAKELLGILHSPKGKPNPITETANKLSKPDLPGIKGTLINTAQKVINNPGDLAMSATMKNILKIKPEDLPLQQAAELLPSISKVQKFDYQDASVLVEPEGEKFKAKLRSYYYGEGDKNLTFEPPPTDGNDILSRWKSWFIGQFREKAPYISSDPKNFSSSLAESQTALIATIKDSSKIIISCPTRSTVDLNRGHAPIIIIDFNSQESTDQFIEFIKTRGTNSLNALFSLLMSEPITPMITKFLKTESTNAGRADILTAIPTTKILVKETTLDFESYNKKHAPVQMVSIRDSAEWKAMEAREKKK